MSNTLVKEFEEAVQFVEEIEVENTVLKTKNYSMFKIDPSNRPIDPKHIINLEQSFKDRDNLLHLYPIIVSRDYTVIDGQHRLMVAKKLKAWVYYIISDVMQPQDARALSSLTKPWKILDYLHHWCALGIPDYLIIRDFWYEHRWLSLSTAAAICSTGQGNGTFKQMFDSGNYKANNMAFGRRVASMILDFKQWINFYHENPFIATMKALAKNPNYDHQRMLSKMSYQHGKLTKQVNTDLYYSVFNEIYNFRTLEDNRVYLHKPVRKIQGK